VGLEAIDGGRWSDERSLVDACVRREAAAERVLFRREYPRVNATVYRILGSARDADDLVQETFVAVFQALPRFRGEARLSTFIDRIAVRVVFHHVRARKPATVSLELVAELEDGRERTDERASARDGLRRLYAVLAALSPDMRVAFALHAIDGRPIAEVARLVSASTVATKLRIWRARREVERRAAADDVLRDYLAAGGDRDEGDVP
jgi:RNA polymerase sigma-70 factor (ECF subfamily)